MSSILDCRVHLSEQKARSRREYSLRKNDFGKSLWDASLQERRARKKWKEQNAWRKSTNRGWIGRLFLPRFVRATYYRRSHVGAQTTDYRVSSSESGRRKTSLGMILLRMNCGANRYDNGRLRRCRGLSRRAITLITHDDVIAATSHPV